MAKLLTFPRPEGAPLPGRRELAARLVAEDDLTDRAIAGRCKIGKSTLERWKLDEAFRRREQQYRAAIAKAVMSQSIASRVNRVRALDDRWRRMQRVITERARAFRRHVPKLAREIDAAASLEAAGSELKNILDKLRDRLCDVPGGETGLITHDVKGVGKGADFQLIDVYEVDVALLRELRDHERQAAQELGQWIEKHQDVDREALIARIERLMAELAHPGVAGNGADPDPAKTGANGEPTVH